MSTVDLHVTVFPTALHRALLMQTDALLSVSLIPQDSVHEKTNAGCRSHKQNLREEGHFLRTYSPGRRGPEPASTASVEYLQQVARVRLCLDLAADFLSELQEGSGKSALQRSSASQVQHLWKPVLRTWLSSSTNPVLCVLPLRGCKEQAQGLWMAF